MAIKLSEIQKSSRPEKSETKKHEGDPKAKKITVKPWQNIGEGQKTQDAPDLLETILAKKSSGKYKLKKIEKPQKPSQKRVRDDQLSNLAQNAARSWFQETNPE